jgi:hypothetical protein
MGIYRNYPGPYKLFIVHANLIVKLKGITTKCQLILFFNIFTHYIPFDGCYDTIDNNDKITCEMQTIKSVWSKKNNKNKIKTIWHGKKFLIHLFFNNWDERWNSIKMLIEK